MAGEGEVPVNHAQVDHVALRLMLPAIVASKKPTFAAPDRAPWYIALPNPQPFRLFSNLTADGVSQSQADSCDLTRNWLLLALTIAFCALRGRTTTQAAEVSNSINLTPLSLEKHVPQK
jgi:hypothetical protein